MNLADKITKRGNYEQYYGRLKTLLGRPAAQVSGLTILTLLTVVFFLFFAILPTFKTIAGLKREIEDAKNTEAKLQQKIHSLAQAEKLYASVLPDLEMLNLVLPQKPELERLAWQIYWLAEQYQVTLVNGSFDEFQDGFIPIKLTAKGSYPSLRNFIAGLNQIDRLIGVEDLSIISKQIPSPDNQLTANLSLKAYFQSGL